MYNFGMINQKLTIISFQIKKKIKNTLKMRIFNEKLTKQLKQKNRFKYYKIKKDSILIYI